MMPVQQKTLIDKLYETQNLRREEFAALIAQRTRDSAEYLFEIAREVQQSCYGKEVYIRGLIEFTNYCRNDCYYCGIRMGNENIPRYRLHFEEILERCKSGYELGFRTFVLQGGEDEYFTDERLAYLIRSIRQAHPDCAITLSVGERSRQSYQKYFDAGADRYLLRHETANEVHYRRLHPPNLSLKERIRCLYDLKEIGYQVGTGFMVESPWQTPEYLAEDMAFIKELSPQMVGIGPFISHRDTPFCKMQSGTLELTLFMVGLLRLMLPEALIPATTALGTIHPRGRELGILAGANVVMPNLSPVEVRDKYMLYDNKISTGAEAAETLEELRERVRTIGYQVAVTRGDPVKPLQSGLCKACEAVREG